MGVETYIVIAVILVTVGLAAGYVIREKKRGKRCIGCPDGCCQISGKEEPSPCSGNCSNCPSCSSSQMHETERE